MQKCNVISFGKRDISYSLCGVTLEQVSHLRDLGVYVSSDFKPGIHCSSIAAKAYSRCSLLLKGFHTSDVSILLRVFKTYVRPLLEFNTPVWSPWLFKDIEHIEGVQRYFTREICKRARLPHMDYASRLENLNLSSLEYRRVYFDLTMCYKIVNKLLAIYWLGGHSHILAPPPPPPGATAQATLVRTYEQIIIKYGVRMR